MRGVEVPLTAGSRTRSPAAVNPLKKGGTSESSLDEILAAGLAFSSVASLPSGGQFVFVLLTSNFWRADRDREAATVAANFVGPIVIVKR